MNWPFDHRCTVVGNPGGILGVFWQILLRGVLGVVRISGGGVVFYCIFMWKFFKNLYRGYMRCPPLPPGPPCVHLCVRPCYCQKTVFQTVVWKYIVSSAFKCLTFNQYSDDRKLFRWRIETGQNATGGFLANAVVSFNAKI